MKYQNVMTAALALLTMSVAFVPDANASTITAPFAGTGGTSSATVSTPSPGNDNVLGQSPNSLSIFENWNGLTFSESFALNQQPAASTEYFVTKRVTNNSGQIWTDFQIGVGCGNGFVACPGFNPLTMDYDQSPTSSAGGTLSSQSLIDFKWTGLNIAPGATVTFTFSLDTCANCSGGWLINQQAGVTATPEPGTVLMGALGLGLIGVGRLRRRLKSSEVAR